MVPNSKYQYQPSFRGRTLYGTISQRSFHFKGGNCTDIVKMPVSGPFFSPQFINSLSQPPPKKNKNLPAFLWYGRRWYDFIMINTLILKLLSVKQIFYRRPTTMTALFFMRSYINLIYYITTQTQPLIFSISI